MSRVNIILLIALIISSMYLVRVAHESRRLYAELDRAQSEEHLLDTEYERLQTEKQAQATPFRVEQAAREKLGMRTATPAVTLYVSEAASAPAVEKNR
jgi:cell division protein FtsL